MGLMQSKTIKTATQIMVAAIILQSFLFITISGNKQDGEYPFTEYPPIL